MEDSSNQSVDTRNYVLVSHFRKTGEKIIESSICKERRRGVKLGLKGQNTSLPPKFKEFNKQQSTSVLQSDPFTNRSFSSYLHLDNVCFTKTNNNNKEHNASDHLEMLLGDVNWTKK